MRIIIVGDGKVGYTLAQSLSMEDHDVVIVDKNARALERANEALDVLTVKGSGASLSTLQEAGIDKADLLIAVTTSDELNMVCTLLGRKLGAQQTIARIRDPEYYEEMSLLQQQIGLNMVINPELTAAQEIARSLRYPQVNNIEVFAGGSVEMIELDVLPSDPIVGRCLSDIAKQVSRVLFSAILREGQVIIPHGDTVVQAGDTVHVVGQPSSIGGFFRFLGRNTAKVRSVMIIGASRIAYYLAQMLVASHMSVKIIELDPENAAIMDDALPEVMVIQGDGTEQHLLQAEGLETMDAFVALTDRDEENLMAALYAREQNLLKVVAKINRDSYSDIIRRMGVSSVVSPKQLTANHILRYVRALENSQGSSIETLYRIIDGKAEALEFRAGSHSKLVGHPLRQLSLKQNALVAAIVRKDETIIPNGDTIIRPDDRVIVVAHGLAADDLDDLLEG